jgi:beta-lactamase class A
MSLADVFERAGCQGYLHACTLDGRHEDGVRSDDSVVPASVMKVLVGLTVEAHIHQRRIDPAERVRIAEGDRTPGPVGMSLFQDAVEVSVRDLVAAMLTISDNVATDALIARTGLDALNETASRLGLAATAVGSDLRTMIESIARDAGFADYAALDSWTSTDPDEIAGVERRVRQAAALRPDATTRTTPRDMTRLLRLLWTDQAAAPAACSRIRRLMAQQLTRNRLASGFGADVNVAAKSGGLMGVVRNEIGVVTFPDGSAYPVAVFTRSDPAHTQEQLVNAAIGAAASQAIGRLRDATVQ